MANIGTHLLRNSSMDQTQVYKRQEKEFNIINFYQKEFKPNLRQFPKLSLENRLLELGKGRSSEWFLRFSENLVLNKLNINQLFRHLQARYISRPFKQGSRLLIYSNKQKTKN